MFRQLMTNLGGRSFLVVVGFCLVAMGAATGLVFREEFNPEHWISTLKICASIVAALLGKRAVEEIGGAFGKNGKPPQ
jgi:hypothetical protein